MLSPLVIGIGVESYSGVLVWIDDDLARVAVDRELRGPPTLPLRAKRRNQVARPDDRRNAVCPSQDRGVRGGRGALEGDTEESFARQRRRHRWRKIVGDNDGRPVERFARGV